MTGTPLMPWVGTKQLQYPRSTGITMTRWEPNGRLGRLEKLAAIVLFLCSDAASLTTATPRLPTTANRVDAAGVTPRGGSRMGDDLTVVVGFFMAMCAMNRVVWRRASAPRRVRCTRRQGAGFVGSPAATVHQSDADGDVQRLAFRVGLPCGADAGWDRTCAQPMAVCWSGFRTVSMNMCIPTFR